MVLESEIKLNADFSYCVDVFDIKLVNRKTNTQVTLKYPDAAIFALIEKGYSLQKTVKMLTHIAHINESHAQKIIVDVLSMLKENNVILD